MQEEEKVVHETMRRVYDATGLVDANSLAKDMDVDSQKIYNWDRRGISKAGALQVAQKYHLEMKWILTGKGDSKAIKVFSETELNVKPLQGRYVPVKSFSKMGMDGYFTEMGFLGDGGDGYIPSLFAGAHAYAIRGDGRSMHPAIKHGWYAICDPDASCVPTEYVEVQFKDGRRTIKEYIGVVNGVLHLLALNTDERLTFDMDEVDSINAIIEVVPPSRHLQDYPHILVHDDKVE